ncbi:MAG: hypothetical protein H8E36_13625 [Rhodospirillaceae bacterium]|nr:hypothetical protein [Rhodospirillaceae bacterium]MBL6930449.1 hypothetical protein [Rhodospirillales bacterium]MBL6942080.1 hypothetical protein [Rhodospirillales bacterium]
MKDSSKLFELARRTQQGEGPHDKYTTLMIANAMAIVARHIELDENDDAEASNRLCQEIRAGEVIPGSTRYDEVYELLTDQARQKVLISNPGYLDK